MPVMQTEASCKEELLSTPVLSDHGILRVVLLWGQRDQEATESSEGMRLSPSTQEEKVFPECRDLMWLLDMEESFLNTQSVQTSWGWGVL